MPSIKLRLQFRAERRLHERLALLAASKGVSVSDLIRDLVERGMAECGDTDLSRLTRVCGSMAEETDSLVERLGGLEDREGQRFRYLLGHLQQMQALVTELVQLQRVVTLADRPADYDKAVELARRQVSEDAGVYRSSLSAGALRKRSAPAQGGESPA